MRAVDVCTLADEFGAVCVEALRALRDALVDVAKQRFGSGSLNLLFHNRLPVFVSRGRTFERRGELRSRDAGLA
jgi:hypothetical protein